ncbi:hypothetical protein L6272_04665 [Microgenomates group bacterium]|nr:hypothetical protein [Microgenomates group bacterium]
MEMVKAGTVTTSAWFEYTAVTDYQGLAIRPPNKGWAAANGIGRIYINPGHAYSGAAFDSD